VDWFSKMLSIWRFLVYIWVSGFSVSTSVSLFSRNMTFQAFMFSYLHFNLLCFSCKNTRNIAISTKHSGTHRQRKGWILAIGDLFVFPLPGEKHSYLNWASDCLHNSFCERTSENTTIAKCVKNHFMSIWFPLDFFSR